MTITNKYFLGIIFIFVCASLWAGSSVLIQYIYSDLSFNSPFFLTYLATSLLAFHLPYWLVKESYFSTQTTNNERRYISASSNDDDRGELMMDQRNEMRPFNCLSVSSNILAEDEKKLSPHRVYTHWDIIKMSMIIAPLWFGANCLYNYSLLMTSVSSSTIIR
jgi:solute carrier family 35, member F5